MSFKGIAEGVENSNFYLQTDRGAFILTLYEKRVQAGDLPFFLGLMDHLAERGHCLPAAGRRHGRRAMVHLNGRPPPLSPSSPASSLRRPDVGTLRRGRRGLWLGLHEAGEGFRDSPAANALGPEGWRQLAEAMPTAPTASRTG